VIDPIQFRLRVIRPTLLGLDPLVPYSTAAENLLLGTALVESRLIYLRQVGGGPARGVYQVEPATHADLWDRWLAFRAPLASRVRSLASQGWPGEREVREHEELETNLAYATAIARLVYRRSPALLPAANDADALAALHKRVFNTVLGKTRVEESVVWFQKVVAGGEFAAEIQT
jgi:hypothetical protein